MSDYQQGLLRHGRAHWWAAGMRAAGWALLGAVNGRVLDAGCGPGWTLAELPPTAWGMGIDRYPVQAVERPRPSIRLACADIAAVPCPSGAFDVVLALDVLEQRCVHPTSALAEMRRVLLPGGRLLLRVPAYPWLFGPHDVYYGGGRRYRRLEVAALLQAAGFTIRRLTYANCLLFPVVMISRLVGRAGKRSGQDLRSLPAALNHVLRAVLESEARWLRGHDLPLGLSLIALAERPLQA